MRKLLSPYVACEMEITKIKNLQTNHLKNKLRNDNYHIIICDRNLQRRQIIHLKPMS